MLKFFIFVGSLLLLLLVVFLLVSYVSPFSQKIIKHTPSTTPLSNLYFEPNPILSSCTESLITTTIYLDSKENTLSGTQLELLYDPTIIYNFSLTPSSENFFGSTKDYTIQLNEVREEYGRASLAISQNQNIPEKQGNKAVATLTFSINTFDASSSSTISFLNKSTTTSNLTNNSLLLTATPLIIHCAKSMNMPSIPLSTSSATVNTSPSLP